MIVLFVALALVAIMTLVNLKLTAGSGAANDSSSFGPLVISAIVIGVGVNTIADGSFEVGLVMIAVGIGIYVFQLKMVFDSIKRHKKKSEKEENEKCMKLYKTCIDAGITEFKGNESRINFYAKSLSMDTENLNEKFDTGRKVYEAKHKENLSRELREDIKKNKELLAEERRKTGKVGKDKYMDKYDEAAALANKVIQDSSKLADYAASLLFATAKTHDSAIVGGIVNGLAGGAAGIAAAAKTEADNEAARAYAEERRKKAPQLRSDASSFKATAEKAIKEIEDIIAKIDPLSVEAVETPDIKFSVSSYKVTDNKAMTINVDIKLPKNHGVNGKKALYDGDIRIDISNKNGKVGEAYYRAPGHGDNIKGIENSPTVTGYAEKGFFDDREYTFEFVVLNVWLVEEKYITGKSADEYINELSKIQTKISNRILTT